MDSSTWSPFRFTRCFADFGPEAKDRVAHVGGDRAQAACRCAKAPRNCITISSALNLHKMSLRLFLLLPAVCALRVTVAGGSGFVGSRVCKYLVENGAEVTSVSKSGKPPAGAGSWASSVKWVANDFTRGSMGELEAALGTPEAFVSCVEL